MFLIKPCSSSSPPPPPSSSSSSPPPPPPPLPPPPSSPSSSPYTQTMDQPSPNNHPPEPTLGAHYYVQRGDSWHVAEIIQRRELDGRTEFYVHYKECTPPYTYHTHTNSLTQMTNANTYSCFFFVVVFIPHLFPPFHSQSFPRPFPLS